MRRVPFAIVAALAALFAAQPASACRMHVERQVEDIRYADVVVVGRITDYRIVRDMEFRRQMLANPDLSQNLRAIYEDPDKTLLGDYAEFNIAVSHVLKGEAPRKLTVTWSNSTFGIPASIPPAKLLIGLRRPDSPIPPLRGPSGTIVGPKDRTSLTVLQAPCSSAFIVDDATPDARAIRTLLASAE